MTSAFPLNQPMFCSEFRLGTGEAGTDPAEPIVPEWAESSRLDGLSSINHALAVNLFQLEMCKNIGGLNHCIAVSVFGGDKDTPRDAWEDLRINRRAKRLGRIANSQ